MKYTKFLFLAFALLIGTAQAFSQSNTGKVYFIRSTGFAGSG
jgi:hypothetical protein